MSSDDCPSWCVYADEEAHTDGYDDPDGEHAGVQHVIEVSGGGARFGDRVERAFASVWLEQARDQATAPRLTLCLNLDGVQYADRHHPPVG